MYAMLTWIAVGHGGQAWLVLCNGHVGCFRRLNGLTFRGIRRVLAEAGQRYSGTVPFCCYWGCVDWTEGAMAAATGNKPSL